MVDQSLSVIGLGKLGLCLAACFAEKGFDTIGVDIDAGVVDNVNRGTAPWFEPGLQELLARHGGQKLQATTSHREAILRSDMTFVLVATPSEPDGSFSNRFVREALRSLAQALKKSQKEHHLFVISSTVMPGSTPEEFIPIIEQYSGRQLNQGFSVCYDPDFVALGNAIHGFFHPEILIIGESMAEAGRRVEAVHQRICENQPAISHMSIINAEIAKICSNAYITTKISFANSIANLCEAIPGADVDAITRAIGPDRRISPHFLQGGLAFGGTCFPRDTQAYIRLAAKHGVQADIVRAADQVNQYQNLHLAQLVLYELGKIKNQTVAILGLAFKPNTSVVTESPALKLIAELVKHHIRVVVYDPLAVERTKAVFGDLIAYAASPEGCLAEAGLAVVTLRHPAFKQAVESYMPAQPLTLIDCWRLIDPQLLPTSIEYIAIGRSVA